MFQNSMTLEDLRRVQEGWSKKNEMYVSMYLLYYRPKTFFKDYLLVYPFMNVWGDIWRFEKARKASSTLRKSNT